jgi:nucleotide-binding universal stress UspA family protein
MYNHILVAVDGSDTSNLALREAIKLAKDQHSALRLIHVVDLTLAYTAVDAPYVADYEKTVQAAGQKVITDCSATVHEAGIKFDTKSMVVEKLGRHVYDTIEEEAKRWPADLCVPKIRFCNIGGEGHRELDMP